MCFLLDFLNPAIKDVKPVLVSYSNSFNMFPIFSFFQPFFTFLDPFPVHLLIKSCP